MSNRGRRQNHSPEASRSPRLQKLLADAGIASRRAAEKLILEGRVELNGRVVKELGTRADPRRDRILVDGKRVGRPRARRSYLVYKPRGVITTAHDPQDRRTAVELVPSAERLFPVGRLDRNSEGLLLLTNDGPLAHALLHPSFQVPRVYRVSVKGRVTAETLRRLSSGVELERGESARAEVRPLDLEESRSVLELTLREGRRHQIRLMLGAVGHPVRRLVRVGFGPLRLRGLRPGEWRALQPAEHAALKLLTRQAEARKPKPGRARPRRDAR
ncbi:MAG: rRNA pseudouridine synthase [Myxococcales bacterium]|nr:rRNA pseudouridine synthase [Myxococcales bacterium]